MPNRRTWHMTLAASSAVWLMTGLAHAATVEPSAPMHSCDWQGQGCWRGGDYNRMIALFAARPAHRPLPAAIAKNTKAAPGALAGMHSRF